MRGFQSYRAVRGAIMRMALPGFRVVHTSIQQNHLHFLVEADDQRTLSRGMQGFAISLARRINGAQRRRGKVFAYRYHATPIRTPTQARRALSYVLNNWRHHQEDRGGLGLLDPFATGHAFSGWTRAPGWYENWAGLPSMPPETWLLAIGWRRGGGPIRPLECP